MIRTQNIKLLLLSVFLMGSCSGNVGRKDSGNSFLSISACVNCKSGETKGLLTASGFSEGSSIGVYASGTGYTETAVSYNKSGGEWKSTDPIHLTKSTAMIYGYYPSDVILTREEMTNHRMPVSIGKEESGQYIIGGFDGTMQSDYMYALQREEGDTPPAVACASKRSPKVCLTFYHGLTCLSFIINKGRNYGSSGKLTSVGVAASLDSIAGTGYMSLSDGGVSFCSNSSSAIKMIGETSINSYSEPSSEEVTARMIVGPLQTAQDINLILKIDGAEYTGTIYGALWESGKDYEYTITIGGEEMSIDSTVDIEGWKTGDPSEVDVK
jgi:hypothetical protein